MATRVSLENLHTTITHETKVAISKEVDPVRDELADLRDRVECLELRPLIFSGSFSKRHLSIINSLDISNLQIAVIGFKSMGLEDRLTELQRLANSIDQSIKPSSFGHFYTGPRSNRQPSSA
eukprot:9472701-Pyramimonas_sp.AAC.1